MQLRAAQQAYGDALGINKVSAQPVPTVVLNDQLRPLMEAISRYALQLLAFASHEPNKHEAISDDASLRQPPRSAVSP